MLKLMVLAEPAQGLGYLGQNPLQPKKREKKKTLREKAYVSIVKDPEFNKNIYTFLMVMHLKKKKYISDTKNTINFTIGLQINMSSITKK